VRLLVYTPGPPGRAKAKGLGDKPEAAPSEGEEKRARLTPAATAATTIHSPRRTGAARARAPAAAGGLEAKSKRAEAKLDFYLQTKQL